MSFKKGAMYVFIANMVNLLISLFTGFVLPKYLSINTYADIKLFQLYITYVGILHLGYADGMYLRNGGKTIENINKKEILEEFKTFKFFQIIVAIIAVIFSIILKNKLLLYCSLVIFPINIGSYLKNLYQAIGEFKRYSRFTNINTLLLFAINVILLLIVKSDDANLYIALYILVYFIYWIFIENENKKIFKPEKVKAKYKYCIEDIKSGIFLMIGNFCNVIFTSIDRLFAKYLIGTVEFAYYSFAVSIENLMNVFVTPISTVMYNYLCNHKEKENIIRIKELILIFSTIIVAVVFPAKFIIQNWISKYNDSLAVLFLLFAAQYISIMVRCIHVNLYKAEKKQNRYFFIMIAIVILSTVLNLVFYLIKPSIEMIALATVITNIVWFSVGELDFKNYRLSKMDYVYIFLVLFLFMYCSRINNALIGLTVYTFGTIVMMFVFIPKSLKNCNVYITREIKKILGKNTIKKTKK